MEHYIHQQIGLEVTCLVGYYSILEEGRLNYHGREVLYTVANATIESSCCGSGGIGYIRVPGYVISWKRKKNESGLDVSEVEPIEDEAVQFEIRKILAEMHPHFSSVDFT